MRYKRRRLGGRQPVTREAGAGTSPRDFWAAVDSEAMVRPRSSGPSLRWVFLSGAGLIIIGFALLGLHAYRGMQAQIARDIDDLAKLREATFNTAMQWTGNTLQQQATLIASDPDVGTYLRAAYHVVAEEGGGAGGQRAAVLRQRLHDLVKTPWEVMADRFDARQLHFHLRPSDTSFLRVHAPDHYGDDLSTVRHTITHSLETGAGVHGFEVGRVVSGVRGVVPIFSDPDEDGRRAVIGAIEAGASLKTTLGIVHKATDAHYAILLRTDHLRRTMWPDHLAAWRAREQPVGLYMIEQTTDTAVRPVLGAVFQAGPLTCDSRLIRVGEREVAFHCFRFRDFLGRNDPRRPAVGRVVTWSDASAVVAPTRAQGTWTIVACFFGAPVMITLMGLVVRLGERGLRDSIRRRTEALNRSRQMFQQVVNTLPEYVFWKDDRGVYQGCNERFATAMGLSRPANIIGHIDETLAWDPEYARRYRSLDVEAMAEEGLSSREEPLWTNGAEAGGEAIGRVRRLPLQGPSGETVGVLVAIEDITEQRRMAAELDRERTLLRTLMETTPDLIFAKDENGIYVAANLAFCAFVGRSEGEVVGMSDFDLFPPEVAQWFIDHDRAAILDEMPTHNEEWVRYPDGELVLLDTLKTPTNLFGFGPGIVGVCRDITQRRRNEEALRENERRLSDIIDATGEFIWETDRDGRFSYVGGRVEKVLGYNPWQIMGRRPSDLMPPDEGERCVAFQEEMAAHPRTYRDKEYRLIDSAGRLRWIAVTGSPIYDRDGRHVGYRGAAADVTERRENEDRLKELSLIASRTDNGVVITDARGHVEWVNDGFTRITGYRATEVLGRRPGDLLQGPASDPAAIARMADALSNGCGFREEIVNYHKSGEAYWVEIEVEPIRNDGGLIVNFMGIQRDVTERRQREDQLHRVQQQLIDAISAIDSGMALYDEQDRLVVFNESYEAFCTGQTGRFELGMTHMEVLQRCIDAGIVVDAPHDRWMADRREAHRVPNQVRDEVLQGRWVRISDRAMSDGGVVTLLTDINEMKRTQTELELARDSAEAAGRAKSQFLANISHELRTPLTAILGYADLLADPDASACDQRNFVQTIRRNGKHLLTVINDLLDLSRIEAGRFELDPHPFEVRQLVEEAVDLFRARAATKGLTLEAEVTVAARRTVAADGARLRQIMLNLVSNAVKFTEAGRIRVQVDLEAGRGDRRELAIQVSDTGVGLDPKRIDELFEPFVQADASTSRKYGGSGLGLAICKNLARALGGNIVATSAPGQGSVFSVWVPVELADDQAVGQPAPSIAAAGDQPKPDHATSIAGHVLLADDAADNRRMLQFILAKLGLTVETVADGQEALDAATEAWQRGEAYSVILMDMQMPRMDGYEATRRLRAAGYEGPIIAVTAHAGRDQHEVSLDAGCDTVVTKPIDLPQLTAALTTYLGSASPK